MRSCNDIRTEMKIGLLLIALFGVFNVILNVPEIVKGAVFAAGIVFLVIGSLRENAYHSLKVLKKRK